MSSIYSLVYITQRISICLQSTHWFISHKEYRYVFNLLTGSYHTKNIDMASIYSLVHITQRISICLQSTHWFISHKEYRYVFNLLTGSYHTKNIDMSSIYSLVHITQRIEIERRLVSAQGHYLNNLDST